MSNGLVVKEQFNIQANNFDHWNVTQDERILQSIYNFFGIGANDNLLDFACGTGAFAIYAAKRIKSVQGVDISEGMIEIAVKHAKQQKLDNINFLCCDVENVPFESESYECVSSKSAFHHMKNNKLVFKEMKRCCKEQGRICIEDVILYDDKKLDDFFENMEIRIDKSHHVSLSKLEIVNLFKQNDIKIFRVFESISELDFIDYVNHAVQTPEDRLRINEFLKEGLQDSSISKCFITRNNTLYWKRKVLSIVGQKQ